MSFYLASCETAPGKGHEDAHKLLAKLYFAVAGTPMPPLCTEDRGKPHWEDGPWHLSISHTRRRAFCLLADCPVGLDAEPLDRKVSASLAEKVLSPEEQTLWADSENDPEVFLTLWTLKEATVKYTGEGLRGYPNNLNFRLDPPMLVGSDLHFHVLQAEDHVISLCASDPIENISWVL